MGNVARWLDRLGLSQYAKVFEDNAIDQEVLPDLTDRDLEKLGVVLGHRKKLLKAIAALALDAQGQGAGRSAPSKPPKERHATAEAERRHLTVLFCDMVGSTELAGRLDPEDMRELLRRFQEACVGCVQRYDGFVAQYMGDGLLVCFGYPKAHEDDAERAIRASLDIVAATAGLPSAIGALKDFKAAVRVGIATGGVVAGNLIGKDPAEEQILAGQTPNLASRLQEVAAPNTVVIGQDTKRIAGNLFEYEALGMQTLKGFCEPLQAWRVVRLKDAETRFDAAHRSGLTPFVGREEEVETLLRRWQRAKGREGQVVLLCGEPGIGKSRIAQTLRDRIAQEPHVHVRYQCSPHFTNSALHPFVEQLTRAAGISIEDSSDRQLDKIEAMLSLAVRDISGIAPLFAALLSIPCGERYPSSDLSPVQHKERTLEALLAHIEGLARSQPLFVLFEDVHWIDPTSLELLSRAIERIEDLPVFVIVTFRPEFAPPWVGQPHVALLWLSRIGRQQCTAMVSELTRGKALPEPILDQIVAKTDGVPLFIEELTKTVLEAGLVREGASRYELTGPLSPLAIPTTLRDSLMARLDRLSAVKSVAQTGAAIGREFSHELLATVSGMTELDLRDVIGQLVGSELIHQRGSPPNVSYIFKHALVQEVAYDSLLKSRRQQLHRTIAEALEQRFPNMVESQPELLAHHYTEAGLAETAVDYWWQAGNRAAQRWANQEAVGHLERGLGLISDIPEDEVRARKELRLLIAIGVPLRHTRGVGSCEVERVYTRARELCRQLGEPRQEFPVLWGLWAFYRSVDFRMSRQLSNELQALAENESDDGLLIQAHHAEWTTHLFECDWEGAIQHCEDGTTLYDPERHHGATAIYGGHDPAVCGYCCEAWSLWMAGYPDRALAKQREGLALSKRLPHRASQLHAIEFGAMLEHSLRNLRAVRTYAEELIASGTEHALERYRASGELLLGWATAEPGPDSGPMAHVRNGMKVIRATGFPLPGPYYYGVAAEAAFKQGIRDEAQAFLSEALKLIERQAVRFWEPEIHRIAGNLQLSLNPSDLDPVENAFSTAIERARAQDAKSLELRAATSLARLWRAQGRIEEACGVLTVIFGWFTEGFDTTDLRDAKALLDELA